MRKLVCLTALVAALLLLTALASASEREYATGKTARQVSIEIEDFYNWQQAKPDWYSPPRVDMRYKVVTYVDTETFLPVEARTMAAPVVRYGYDCDGDGLIDWMSDVEEYAQWVYRAPGRYDAVMYAFDIYGEYSTATVRVEVRSGSGRPALEADDYKFNFRDSKPHNPAPTLSAVPDPARRFFLIMSDPSAWNVGRFIYSRLLDSMAYMDPTICDSTIVAVGGGESWPQDSVFIDYSFTAGGVDSAYTYLIEQMTENDDLHIISIAHGGGMYDSSCVYFNDYNALFCECRPYELAGGRIIVGGDDPDLYTTEADFKWAVSSWWNSGKVTNTVGLDEWASYWNGQTSSYRTKRVAKFKRTVFANTTARDNDIYIETMRQYLAGDSNHNYSIEPELGEVWDFDGDGNPPIDTLDGAYVFDEDDWGDLYLTSNPGKGKPVMSTLMPFDEDFDGNAEFCYHCWEDDYKEPIAHGRDLDNDGTLDELDLNKDGDWDDSVGVDEKGLFGYDNDLADFVNMTNHRYVSVIMNNCFSGGFINDLSQPGVLITTATVEGTVAFGWFFADIMAKCLTGGSYDLFDPGPDRIASFAEAFNAYIYPTKIRLDDNGDRVGHGIYLPNEGDGDFAAEFSWGTLPPHIPRPVLISPLDGETFLENLTPTFVWSDSADADSFAVVIYPYSTLLLSTDTVLTLTDSTRLDRIPSSYRWNVRAHKNGLISPWSDTSRFEIVCDYECCEGMRGDFDGDGDVDPLDLAALVAFVYEYGDQPACFPEANVDAFPCYQLEDTVICLEMPNGGDVIYLSEYLYNGGPPPWDCSEYQFVPW